jgi:hypothetical protein
MRTLAERVQVGDSDEFPAAEPMVDAEEQAEDDEF